MADEGFKGMVIKIQMTKSQCQIKSKIQTPKIYAGAGVLLSQLVNIASKNNLTGLEWAAGIPGTIGGAIYGNAGAFGRSMANVVKTVEVLEVQKKKNQKSKIKNQKHILKIKKLSNKDCQFGYRESVFKHNQNLIILSAELQLKKGKKSEIQKKIKEYLAYRKKAHPLNFPSAGSIFKNYQLAIDNYQLLKKYPEILEFNKKGMIPAGFLIEKAGLKGKKIGQAQISEKHANFIVNLGKARAVEVIELIKLIKKEVKNKFNIILEEEIKIIQN